MKDTYHVGGMSDSKKDDRKKNEKEKSLERES